MDANKERNRALQEIAKSLSKSLETECKNKNDKSAFWISLLSVCISFLTMVITFGTPYISYKIESINKPLVLGEKIDVYFDNESSKNYNITFSIEQGGLKKAYIANWEDDGSVVYENIIENLDGESLRFSRKSKQIEVNKDNNNVTIKNGNTNKIYLMEGYICIRKIEDFALVLLDTTGQWWIYYFISSPEIIPENIEYNLQLVDESGSVVTNVTSEIQRQEVNYVIIDGTLTSNASIEKALIILDTDYYLFGTEKTFEGENGAIITSNPVIKNIYNPPSSISVYDKITQIHKDISFLSI